MKQQNTLLCRLNILKTVVWVLLADCHGNINTNMVNFVQAPFYQPRNFHIFSFVSCVTLVHLCNFIYFIYNLDALYLPEIKWQLSMPLQLI